MSLNWAARCGLISPWKKLELVRPNGVETRRCRLAMILSKSGEMLRIVLLTISNSSHTKSDYVHLTMPGARPAWSSWIGNDYRVTVVYQFRLTSAFYLS